MRGKSSKPPGRPFVKGDPRAGRPKGTPNKVTKDVREVARALVEDPAYRERIAKRLHSGELPPVLEAMLWYYAYGKPKETNEFTGADGGPIEAVTRIEWVIVDGKRGQKARD